MELLEKYKQSIQDIYDYFGYEDTTWTVYPLDDNTEYWWHLENDDEVWYYESLEAYENEDGMKTYSCEIINHRHLKKGGIYEGKDFTMILIDTHTDGNKFLSIFDNSKKITRPVKYEKDLEDDDNEDS